MLGVIVNTIAVIVGSIAGLIFHKAVPERIVKAVMIGIGLCTVYIGVAGMLKGENTLILIISMVLGAIIGTLLDIDAGITKVGDFLSSRFRKPGEKSSITEGFVTASLIFCVGPMTIVGSLTSGLTGNHETIFTKSLLDLITSVMLAASLGYGVIFAAVFVLIFQGAIVLMATTLQPLLNSHAIAEMTCAGAVIILALGLNILGLSKFKVANYLPAIVLAPLLAQFM
jgi:uncharacterized protein